MAAQGLNVMCPGTEMGQTGQKSRKSEPSINLNVKQVSLIAH